jgi:hypothetical protein
MYAARPQGGSALQGTEDELNGRREICYLLTQQLGDSECILHTSGQDQRPQVSVANTEGQGRSREELPSSLQ